MSFLCLANISDFFDILISVLHTLSTVCPQELYFRFSFFNIFLHIWSKFYLEHCVSTGIIRLFEEFVFGNICLIYLV